MKLTKGQKWARKALRKVREENAKALLINQPRICPPPSEARVRADVELIDSVQFRTADQ